VTPESNVLRHSVSFNITLRGWHGESAGFMKIDINEVPAAEILKWIDVPLDMLRAQADADARVQLQAAADSGIMPR
jgi:hypothetical protein